MLNEEQRQAVEASFEEPLCIIAGPGSGKTSTLVERVIRLIHLHINTNHPISSGYTGNSISRMQPSPYCNRSSQSGEAGSAYFLLSNTHETSQQDVGYSMPPRANSFAYQPSYSSAKESRSKFYDSDLHSQRTTSREVYPGSTPRSSESSRVSINSGSMTSYIKEDHGSSFCTAGILFLTFSRSAVKELERRIQQRLPSRYLGNIHIRTFHR